MDTKGEILILDFSIRNFGPFRDRVTISLNATALRDDADNIFEHDQVRGGLLTSALVFGANASGKSYLIKALSALRYMLARPYLSGEEYAAYQPFRLSCKTADAPTDLRIRILIGGILYDYSISYTRNAVVSESLYHYPKGRRARVFVRTGPGEFEYGSSAIIDRTNPGSSYVVVASSFNDRICELFRREVLSGIVILDGSLESLVQRSCEYTSGNDAAKGYAMRALKTADMGISDYHSVEREIPMTAIEGTLQSTLAMSPGKIHVKDIFLKHDLAVDGVGVESTVFPIDIESSGTKAMFGLMGPLVDVLLNGKVLVIDEFGSNLHPLISRWIVGQFSNGPNPNHAQLIVNTHDIGLMDTDGLVRRDQVWFVNKNRSEGSSDLYSLADFKDVRKIKSIGKAYLAGRFDAVPSIRARDVIE